MSPQEKDTLDYINKTIPILDLKYDFLLDVFEYVMQDLNWLLLEDNNVDKIRARFKELEGQILDKTGRLKREKALIEQKQNRR